MNVWHSCFCLAASNQQSAAAAGRKSPVGMARDAVDEDIDDAEDQITKKYGVGGINQPIGKQNRQFTYCPLHIAAQKCDIVSMLLLTCWTFLIVCFAELVFERVVVY